MTSLPSELRIVSLLPSATEIICALGLEDRLLGISHSCDYPSSIQQLPVLTESVVDPTLPSAEIDRLTKEALARGESLYRLNEPLLRELEPNVVVTQALCDVCAISFPSVARAVASLPGSPTLISLEPGSIEQIFGDIEQVAMATGTEAVAERLITDELMRMARLQEKVRELPRPSVLTLEWFAPAYYGGHWVPEQVQLGGGISVMGAAHERSSGVTWESIAAADPDVILCMPCGYNTEQTRELLREIEQEPYFTQLRAVQQGQVWCVDANAYFSRPSPRVIQGAELIAHVLHPEHVQLPEGVAAPLRLE